MIHFPDESTTHPATVCAHSDAHLVRTSKVLFYVSYAARWLREQASLRIAAQADDVAAPERSPGVDHAYGSAAFWRRQTTRLCRREAAGQCP